MSTPVKAAIGVVLLAIVAYIAFDALTTSDEERIEAFAEAVTGDLSREQVNAAFEAYVDLGRQPLEVTAFGEAISYGEGSLSELKSRASSTLRPYYGTKLRIMSQTITIDGDAAELGLRVIGDAGMANLRFRLHRHDESWLVEQVALER